MRKGKPRGERDEPEGGAFESLVFQGFSDRARQREKGKGKFKSRLAHQQEITRKPLKIKGFRVFLLLWVWLFSLMFSLMRLKTGKNGAVRRPKDTETGTAG